MSLPDQIQELISVDQALSFGRKMFIFLFSLTLFFIALKDGPAFSKNLWLVFGVIITITFLIGFFLPFLFLSKRTTRWKIWAFAHMNDVQDLKKAALRAALCAGVLKDQEKLEIVATVKSHLNRTK